MNLKYFFIFIFCLNVNAIDFKPGSGSLFIMQTEGQKVDLSIYVADRSNDSLNIEMHFGAGGIIPVHMWQQFEFKLQNKAKPIGVTKGFIKTKESKNPEIMTDEFFKQNKGVQVEDFLFSNAKDLEVFLKGTEIVEVPAGAVSAKRYVKNKDGQKLEFWISEKVGPIGLVKLVSSSKKNKQANYTIELKSLLMNVLPTIDPKKAVPMSKSTKSLLGKSPK